MKEILILVLIFGLNEATPLEDFVFDDTDLNVVRYDQVKIVKENFLSKYHINLTTCSWFEKLGLLLDPNVPYWTHEMIINVPKNLNSSRPVFFFIDSGRLDQINQESEYEKRVTLLAINCKCITVIMKQVPNQPLQFATDPNRKEKMEDELVAWTFHMYIFLKSYFPNDTFNYTPLQFPMTKSVKRGFDVLFDFLKSKDIQFTEKIIVSGHGKRGWTAWLIGAIDDRVVGIIPINFDLLNWHKSFHSQYKSLGGGYSYAFRFYLIAGLSIFIDEVNIYQLGQLVDPYSYLHRYMNKNIYLISSTSSEYSMVENMRFFWNELRIHSKHSFIRRVPNAGNDLENQINRIFININNFLSLHSKHSVTERALPKFRWKFVNDKDTGQIWIHLSDLKMFQSYDVRGFFALSLSNRSIDFRNSYLDDKLEIKNRRIAWNSRLIARVKISNSSTEFNHKFIVNRSDLNDKYMVFYVEVNLKLKNKSKGRHLVICTDVNRLPEYYPVGDCYERECLGKQF
ncbi:autocrine proliferation repressor A-like [Brachionus plicatilis]|uniref:Autocrine proliferation repressor A-like n=1 Tax=Brachionus plicatilis TaxID=10195 RepID=A0A3M7SC99_BRAPC|nr:autocrine proliferation repressor A-like [Brachionus plicatilis]